MTSRAVRSLLAFIALVVFHGTRIEADVIDFSGFTDGTVITSQYLAQGVTFGGTDDPEIDNTSAAFYGPLASGNILISGGGSPNIIEIIFSSPMASVAADIIFRDTDTVASLEVFDAGLTSLGVFTTAPDTGLMDEVTLTGAAANIARARFTFDPTDSTVGIDNLVFEPIPEPGTLVLLSFGLAAIGVVGRRRRPFRS